MKTKKINVAKELAALQKMSPAELRERYADLYGETTRSGNRQWLVRRCAWRTQALAEGGLSDRAKRRAQELARDQDIRVIPPPGLTMDPLDHTDCYIIPHLHDLPITPATFTTPRKHDASSQK